MDTVVLTDPTVVYLKMKMLQNTLLRYLTQHGTLQYYKQDAQYESYLVRTVCATVQQLFLYEGWCTVLYFTVQMCKRQNCICFANYRSGMPRRSSVHGTVYKAYSSTTGIPRSVHGTRYSTVYKAYSTATVLYYVLHSTRE